MRSPRSTPLAVAALLVVALVGAAAPAAGGAATVAGAPDPLPVVLEVGLDADGSPRLVSGSGSANPSADEPAVLELAREGLVEWDLTGLDRSLGDVEVRLAGLRGPGSLTAFERSLDGYRLLLDSGAPTVAAALPAGGRGSFWLRFDQVGRHEVDLQVRVPTGAGQVRLDSTVVAVVHEPSGAPAPPQAPVPAAPASSSTTVPPTTAATPAERALDDVGPGVRSATGTGRVVIDDGHVDMGPRFVGGTWVVQLKDDTVSPIVWRNLRDVVLHARESSRIEVPEGAAYAFLGAPGSPVYVLPQSQQPGLVWPGWNSQDPSVLAEVPGSITWRLHDVDGPGRFVLFLSGSFGQTDVLFDSDDSLPQQLAIARNTHVHGNWAFTEPGVYRLTVEMSAQRGSGGQVSDTRTLVVVVGDDVDPSTAFTDDPPGSPPPPGADDELDAAGGGPGGSSTGGAGGAGGTDGGFLASTGIAELPLQLAAGLGLLVAGLLLFAVSSAGSPGSSRRRFSIATPRPTNQHPEEGTP